VPRPVPGGRVEASAVLLVPDRRGRDEGNYRTPLENALGDALVRGAWLPDDTPAHYRFGYPAPAAACLGLTMRRIYDLTSAGRLAPDGRDGRTPLFTRATLDAYARGAR
jgi:hypothetical protein